MNEIQNSECKNWMRYEIVNVKWMNEIQNRECKMYEWMRCKIVNVKMDVWDANIKCKWRDEMYDNNEYFYFFEWMCDTTMSFLIYHRTRSNRVHTSIILISTCLFILIKTILWTFFFLLNNFVIYLAIHCWVREKDNYLALKAVVFAN